MKKITIALCEKQNTYRERLAEYLIQKKKGQLKVFTFSDRACFAKKERAEPFDIVLLGRGFGEVKKREEGNSLYIFLSETPDWPREQEPAVFKYQSAEEILRNVFEYYLKMEKINPYVCRKDKEIIGIYSPSRSRMQTPFALTLAQVFSEEKKSLYVNLGEWAGFVNWFQEEYRRDLADLLYLISYHGSQVQGILECVIHSMNRMDYIPPMTDAQLLCRTGAEDYLTLLQLLVEKTGYEAIFLDFGFMIPGFFELLEQCTAVYAVTDQGVMAKGQCQQFEKSLIKCGLEHLEEKMEYVYFSAAEEQLMEQDPVVNQWLYGVLGDRARAVRYKKHGTD